MRFTVIILIAAAGMSAPLGAAFAKSAYYVQLGAGVDEQDAETKWDVLRNQYPALLDDLRYSPRYVSAESGGQEVRIQAGPTASKDAAQRICASLTEHDTPCFIAETAVFDDKPSIPQKAVATKLTPREEAKPVETAAVDDAVPANAKSITVKKKSGGWFDWLFGDEEETETVVAEAPAEPVVTPAPETPAKTETAAAPAGDPVFDAPAENAPAPASEAEMADAAPAAETSFWDWLFGDEGKTAQRVEVAEAIPVQGEAQVSAAAPTPEPAPKVKRIPDAVRFVHIAGFETEQQAFDFSETVKNNAGDNKRLRTQTNRPLFTPGASRDITVSAGPVENFAEAEKICASAAQSSLALTCTGSEKAEDITRLVIVNTPAEPVVTVPAPTPELAPAAAGVAE